MDDCEVIIETKIDEYKFYSAQELFYKETDDDGYDLYVPFNEIFKHKCSIIKNKAISKLKSILKMES